MRVELAQLDGREEAFDAGGSVGIRRRVDDFDLEPFQELARVVARVIACPIEQE